MPLPADAGPPCGTDRRLRARSQAAITRPKSDREGDAIELIEEPEGLVCRSLAAGPPGVIRIERGEQTVFALASAIPEQESDLAPLPASVFQNRLAGDRSLSFRDANRQADEAADTPLGLAGRSACAVAWWRELILLRVLKT